MVFQDKGCCNDSLSRQGVLHCVVFQDRGCYTVWSFKRGCYTVWSFKTDSACLGGHRVIHWWSFKTRCTTRWSFKTAVLHCVVFQDRRCYTVWSFKTGCYTVWSFKTDSACLPEDWGWYTDGLMVLQDGLLRQVVLYCVVFQDRGCYITWCFKTNGTTLMVFQDKVYSPDGLLWQMHCYILWHFKMGGAALIVFWDKVYFTDGLPRTGGTTLCSLSRQVVLHWLFFMTRVTTLVQVVLHCVTCHDRHCCAECFSWQGVQHCLSFKPR